MSEEMISHGRVSGHEEARSATLFFSSLFGWLLIKIKAVHARLSDIVIAVLPEEGSMLPSLSRNGSLQMFRSLAQRWQHAPAPGGLCGLNNIGREQLDRLARDFGLSASELCLLVNEGADGTILLRRRMTALHVDPDEISCSEPGLFRDLRRVCAACGSRGECVRDLAKEPAEPDAREWRDYCPNVAMLNMLSALESYSRARP
jgi:hypothetical protein